MNLFKRIAHKLASLVSGKPGTKATTVPDFSSPPPKWLPFARPAVRRNSWFRAVIKSQLRRADVSKQDKRRLRKNLFQGHWSTALMRRRVLA